MHSTCDDVSQREHLWNDGGALSSASAFEFGRRRYCGIVAFPEVARKIQDWKTRLHRGDWEGDRYDSSTSWKDAGLSFEEIHMGNRTGLEPIFEDT
jgi:hypothetical protein